MKKQKNLQAIVAKTANVRCLAFNLLKLITYFHIHFLLEADESLNKYDK